jgi:signal transduction histidine kinase
MGSPISSQPPRSTIVALTSPFRLKRFSSDSCVTRSPAYKETNPQNLLAMRWRLIGNTVARLTVCTVVVLALPAVLYTVPLSDRSLTAALTFLFMILVVSAVWGFRYSIFVSALTTLAFSWLLPPVGVVFWLDDPHDVLTLAAFLVIGIITSHLSDRAHKERERLRQQEAELAHFSRLTMIGELAASLAHEIKQPIAAAELNAKTCERLRRDAPDVTEACHAASAMVAAVTRAADIIDRVSSLYRRDAPQRKLIDPNKMIREMTILLGDVANRNSISIRTELDGGLPTIAADGVQLQQVLMNLMLNSIEAMKDIGGELRVTSKTTKDGQLLVSVSDSGVGLPADKTDRIFRPFFTTKPQGTGLGLSVSRKIIESHGGRLWASANVPRGGTSDQARSRRPISAFENARCSRAQSLVGHMRNIPCEAA